jgi:hypothetical protein
VDYRLAPAAPLEDIYSVVWLHANASQFGLDPARSGIKGESGGGDAERPVQPICDTGIEMGDTQLP